MPLMLEKTAQHSVSVEDAAAFRIPYAVTEILLFPSGNSYPLCPRCNRCLDREYMRFCDSCGQRLEWKNFRSIRIRKWGDKNEKAISQNR